MLDSVIYYSDLRAFNRLDAEYYQLKFLESLKKLKKGKYKKLREVCEFIRVGPSGSALPACEYTPSGGIKVLRPSNLNDWNCDNGDVVYITQEYCKKKRLQKYKSGDILISRVGDLKYGIIEDVDDDRITISPNIFVLRSEKNIIDPFFLLAFLNTEFAFSQIQRGKKIVSLASVGKGQITDVFVPILPAKNQKIICNLVKRGLNKIRLAKVLYSQAEENLLRIIGFTQAEKKASFVAINLSHIISVRRADAEYFISENKTEIKPAKEKIKWIRIEEIADVSRGIEIGRKEYIKNGKLFLRVSNISKYGPLCKSQKFLSTGLYKKLKKKYQPHINEILLVKDGKPGVAYVVKEPVEAVISEGIVRLKPEKNFGAEYLSLCINSSACQSQIQIDKDGSLMPHWKINQIRKLRLPLISLKERERLRKVVEKSCILFLEGNKNLTKAKKEIEKLIKDIY